MKRNFYLIDTNIVIRFLTKDQEILSEKSSEIFEKIERGEIKAKVAFGTGTKATHFSVRRSRKTFL